MSHVVPGRRAVLEALGAGRALYEVLLVAERDDDEVSEAAETAGVPLRVVERARLDEVAEGVAHQGVLARAPHFAYTALEDLDGEPCVVLDGVTDPQNLGAIARTAEAFGAAGLVLPKRRSASVTPAVERAAAGALSWLPVAKVPNLPRALAALSERNLWSVGLAGEAAESVWTTGLLDAPVAIVLGAEGRGLSRLVAERCDALAAIPLTGRVASLNVSAAAAAALCEVARRRAG
ncbi:23S rRNA (guanosine(2251)-2'-O)-methyltransferase RlmB [Egibacter rhizosphaerae]|uniref:23S rRNA (Guanosine(2251)-2'-O)-methyltransferase RlmB n=1 Tax=Egibacter rhizosphaerae TaxID=1670831 RepID=A0A411YDL0_9ACTN|nr:23S rRNA (guanosine(2251)-2'-O)-methyltransferase RlmB [Egibacter rhizosphaerae]QBI19256.1 23S rRNA (guanosine(2251)-2'-O)-methyltransferase RlmB [Egibacter rhizosphaerae]